MLLHEILNNDDKSSLEHLANSLATFDWHYEMTDDHRVWTRAHERLDSLVSQVQSLSDDDRNHVLKSAVRLSPSREITNRIRNIFAGAAKAPATKRPARAAKTLADTQRGHIEGMARRGIEKIYFYDTKSVNFRREPDGSVPSRIKNYVEDILATGKFDHKYEKQLRELVK